MLNNYLNKPIGRHERWGIRLILLILVPYLFLRGFASFILNLDMCYEGLLPNAIQWYVDLCEKSSSISVAIGLIWLLLSMSLSLMAFNTPSDVRWLRWLSCIPMISIIVFASHNIAGDYIYGITGYSILGSALYIYLLSAAFREVRVQ